MIKLFRNFRRNLLNEGKTTKYFKYAIGEIILVVIGILIALQVNNWNEIRKSETKTELLFDKLEDELILTVKNANHDIKNAVFMDSVIKRVLENKMTRDDYINTEELRSLLMWRFTLNPELDNLKKLAEREEGLNEKYKDILFDIYDFSYPMEREIEAKNLLRISSEQNTDYINLNFSWARLSDSLSVEKAYQYFLTDAEYKNRLYTHLAKALDYNRIISAFRAELLKIVSKLKVIREGYSPSQLEEFLKSLDQKPFEKIEINSDMYDLVADDDMAKSSLIANFNKDTLKIIMKNRKGNILWSRIVVPGGIYGSRFRKTGIINDDLKIYEVYKKEVRIATYKEVQNGYLILK